MADELIIDDEFQRLLAPLSDDERRLLEISIKTEGVRDPLTLWGSTLVDGHNRKDICERLGVDWECRQLDIVGARAAVMVEWPDANVEAMDDRTVVGLWIIRNQSGRRNLTNYARCELQFEAEKRIPGRKRGSNQHAAKGEGFQNSENAPPANRVKDAAAKAGVSHDTYAKAKAIHEAVEEGVVAPEVIDQLKRGEESVNSVYQQITNPEKKVAHVSHNSGDNEWYTPGEYIEAAREVMGSIDLDPATSEVAQATVQAAEFFTQEDDGLVQDWSGNVWMNPPYAQPLCANFCHKLAESHISGAVEQAVVLVNNATETRWFRELADIASAICFISGRVRFLDEEGNPGGAPLQGQAVLYFGSDTQRFTEVFCEFGFVALVQHQGSYEVRGNA